MLLKFLLIAALVTLAGCGPATAQIQIAPTPAQAQQVRLAAVRAADVVTTTMGILDETGKLLNDLPIPVATKDRFDCAILSVVGTAQAATPAVTRTCGAVPLSVNAPLPIALQTLKAATTCPSLRATLASVYPWVTPLITQLEAAENPALRMAGASLRVTLSLLTSGGVTCSL